MADSTVLGTCDALCQELDEIERRRRCRADHKARQRRDDLETHEQRARRLELAGLCLSGGGIRSAAFCLGVLQALAEKRLLRRFDYLSTVSGGGFIGGWLQVLVRDLGSVGSAESAISQSRPEALRRLRAYTNYLTPQTGPLSVDAWTGVVLYIRNLLINWAVFAPLFLLLTLVPLIYRTAIGVCSESEWTNAALLAGASMVLLYGVVRACNLLPSHRPPHSAEDPRPKYASTSGIRWGIVYPALAWTLVLPWLLDFAEEALGKLANDIPWLAYHTLWVVPVVYLSLMTFGYSLAWWLQSHREDPGIYLFRANFGRWILASLGAALLTWLVLRTGHAILSELRALRLDSATALTVLAPLALAIVHVLQTSLYIALRRETQFADLDREWLARVNAMILRLAAGWTVFALCCLILPVLVSMVNWDSQGFATWSAGRISTLGSATALIGGFAAWLGKIWPSVEALANNPANRDQLRAYLPVALGVLFSVCLLVVFGGVLNFVLAQLQLAIANAQQIEVTEESRWLPLVLQAVVAIVLFVGVATFQHVNVNRFSMHAVYRNRLTRAFLGSARSRRRQDPFTGFDLADNTPLSALLNNGNSLFPIINMTLNITAGKNMAWGGVRPLRSLPHRWHPVRPSCVTPGRTPVKSTRAARLCRPNATPDWRP
jgi:hypothetical protein